MKNIVIIGGGSFIGNLINYIESMNSYKVIGYTDITDNGLILDIPYLGNDDILQSLYMRGVKYAAIGIGNKLNNTVLKQKVVLNAMKIGFKFPPIKGKNVTVHRGVKIGEGSIIRDGTIIQSNCDIGKFVIIGDKTVVSHDATIGDFSQLATGCILGSGTKLGVSVFIGYSAVVGNNLKIVDECIIGAKSFVNKDCSTKGLYFGQPAKLIKNYE